MSSLEKLKLKVCALCHQNSELELSHIIPKFAIRYLKETSIGQLRSTDNPNSTIQDGEKHPHKSPSHLRKNEHAQWK